MSNTNPVTVESENPQDAKLEALRSLFPEAFREWKLDTTLLSATLGESISNERESYGMSWAGKSDARKQIVTPTTKSLSPDGASSVDFTSTDNILIEWDNLEVLKLLQKSYTKQVKMIYIDPPYNTGKDFVYHDNFYTSTAEYEEASGQRDSEWVKLVQNTETNGRYHSDWLSMIYPRLHLARNLLRDDGVIFVSIDDNEVHNLRKVMDEIFWEENFIGSLIIQTATDNNPWQIKTEHEYMICFAKNISNLDFWFSENKNAKLIETQYYKLKEKFTVPSVIETELRKWIKSNEKKLSWVTHYDNVDERGVYHDWDIANTVFGGYTYDVLHPVTGRICKVPDKGFRFPKETLMEMIKNDEVVFGEDETVLMKPKKRIENAKDVLRSVIYEDGRTSTKKFDSLMSRDIFQNPKSDTIIARIINFVTKENDIVLDFFAGSWTTGESVMQNNCEYNKKLKFILVQLPENLDESIKLADNKAKKTIKNAIAFLDSINKPHNISEITAERLHRAGKKIKEDNPSVSFDSGFRLYRLTPSCYQVASVEYDSEDSQTTLESLERAIQSGISPLREWVSEADVIVENLIKEWFLLNSRLENIQIGDNQFLHAEREWKRLYLSFESDISMSTIQSLSREYSEAIFVVYDKALDDSRKVMISDRVKLRTI